MNANAFARNLAVLAASLMIYAAAGVCCADTPAAINLPVAGSEVSIPIAPASTSGEGVSGIAAAATATAARIIERFDLAAFNKLSEKSSLAPIFKKGGPIMWPLLIGSILALGTVIDRLFFLIGVRVRRDKKALQRLLEAISEGRIEEAIRIAQASKYHVVRPLGYALTHRAKSLANALLYAQEQEMKRFRRGIPILDTVITLAPLLGLLGTVTGMMGSFSLIGGELSAPGAITGGIAEALIATAFGLGIAITSLLPFNYLNTRMEEAQVEIKTAATQMQLAMHGKAIKPRMVEVAPIRESEMEEEFGELAAAV